MVMLLSYYCNNGGAYLFFSSVARDRSGNPPIPPAAGRPGADDRIRQLTDKKFTSSFKISFSHFKSSSIIFSPDNND